MHVKVFSKCQNALLFFFEALGRGYLVVACGFFCIFQCIVLHANLPPRHRTQGWRSTSAKRSPILNPQSAPNIRNKAASCVHCIHAFSLQIPSHGLGGGVLSALQRDLPCLPPPSAPNRTWAYVWSPPGFNIGHRACGEFPLLVCLPPLCLPLSIPTPHPNGQGRAILAGCVFPHF